MQRSQIVLLCVIGLLLLIPCQQAIAGWGLPNLNPFSKSKREKPLGPNETADGGGWGLPTLPLPKLPGFGGSKMKQPQGPASKKSMLTRTKETIFPWTKSDPTPQKVTGTTKRYQPRSSFASDDQETGTSIFSSWFSPAKEKAPVPLAPHEWLGNPRPD